MTKKEAFFFGGFWLWLGVVIGFLLSPIKKGVEIGNNNTCDNNSYEGKKKKRIIKTKSLYRDFKFLVQAFKDVYKIR